MPDGGAAGRPAAIDGRATTYEWQVYEGDTCVLPVGSFEQHGAHLPLDTDNIEAEFFARLVAEDLGAALLPALRFATCLEHSGFRGSISLRPETLMQVIRDLADEVERQHFRIMVVVNAHGGNHCLVPVVRDLNRADRPLKILLVPFWEFCDPAVAADSQPRGLDIHAGEWETSLMLALRPDLVRGPGDDLPEVEGGALALAQRDLTTFGAGHFNPGGAIGYPSLASEKKGRAIIASIRERLLPYVRDRVHRLRQQGRYAGSGGLATRRMEASDVPAGIRLKDQAGWNQTEEDWRLFLALSPEGCFVSVHDGRVVGTVTTLKYGSQLSWISMLLVDPEFRGIGVGTSLLRKALQSLEGCETIKLDATPAGRRLYERLGFKQEHSLRRMAIGRLPFVPAPAWPGVVPIEEGAWDGIAALDRRVFGADRVPVLRALQARLPGAAWQVDGGRCRGFCLGRRGTGFDQVGPVVAERVEDATALCQAALAGLVGRAVALDVPALQRDFLAWLRGLGFAEQRSFTRMCRPGGRALGALEQQFAAGGPELG